MSRAKTVFRGKHLIVRERDDWQFVERPKAKEAVAVIATTAGGELILTEQFRKPVNARVIDWPAGLVGDDGTTDPEATARKELKEETGYTCKRVELVASGPTSPGITSETVSLYRALNAKKTGKGGGVGGEKIKVHTVPPDEIEEWLKERESDGVLIDMKVWAGLYYFS